jgi:hypothetical protein
MYIYIFLDQNLMLFNLIVNLRGKKYVSNFYF